MLITDALRLRDAAVDVLRRCDRGPMLSDTPDPARPQQVWEVAILAMGLARCDVPRAIAEMRVLFDAQWSTGRLPYGVFVDDGPLLEPGVDVWGTDRAAAAPTHVRTSGIVPAPAHAIVVRQILELSVGYGGADAELAEQFADESYEPLLAWHRWIRAVRDVEEVGLLEFWHPWESLFDGSGRWDAPLSRTGPCLDATCAEHKMWLIEQMRAVDHDDDAVRAAIDFRVRDVFASALFAASCEVLAGLGEYLGHSEAVDEMRETAARFRAGVATAVCPDTGLARDFDVRAGVWLPATTIAGFAPLVAGGEPDLMAAQRALLLGEEWMGHPVLHQPLPPSVSPSSPDFRRRQDWHGPIWPPALALLSLSAARDGQWELRALLQEASIEMLADGSFSRFYEPVTGQPLGGPPHAWTAASALELLG